MPTYQFAPECMIDLDRVTFPTEIDYDPDELYKLWGNKVATYARKKLTAGQTWSGSALPNGWDLHETGSFIRSIRWDKRHGAVEPNAWRRRSDVGRKVRTNFGLLKVLQAQSKTLLDIFGDNDPKRSAVLADLLQEVVDKMLRDETIRLAKAKGETVKARDALARGIAA